MLRLAFVVLALYICTASCSISRQTKAFTLAPFARRRGQEGAILQGFVGQRPPHPRRMHQTICQNKLFVTWTERTGQVKDPKNAANFIETTAGHITEFSLSTTGVPTLVKDTKFAWCNEMGKIHSTDDCSLITALCRSSAATPLVPNYVNILTLSHNQPKLWGFGWNASSVTDPASPHFRIVDSMYLLEFASGISATPTTTVKLSQALGGWDYGHYEVALNSLRTIYFISLKTTVFANGGWHEGLNSFSLERNGWKILESQWGCGAGHVLANRVAYNKQLNIFSRYCLTDLSQDKSERNAIYYGTNLTNPSQQIHGMASSGFWDPKGGPGNLVSLDGAGWIGSATGPAGVNAPITIGIIKLPGDSRLYNKNVHKYKWIDLPGTTIDNVAVNPNSQVGYPSIQKIGKSGAFLLGWATEVSSNGIPKAYHIAEVDSNGCLGPVTSLMEGWGIDNTFEYHANSGCVLYTHTWVGSTSSPYADCNDCSASVNTQYSNQLRITSVCPTGAPTFTCKFVARAESTDTATFTETTNDALPVWAWVVIGVAIVAIIGVVIAVVFLRSRKVEML